MNFTIASEYRSRQARRESNDLAPAIGIRNALLLVLPCWAALGWLLWSVL